MKLRDYQLEVIDGLRREIGRGAKRILLQAPTGAGKTVIAAEIIEKAADKGKRVLFLAHRRELVKQCESKLFSFGVDHGIIMAGEFLQMEYEVQVASIDTLRARALNSDKMPLPRADVIFIDEAHRSLAESYLRVLNAYPKAIVIGMTATPIRTDGRGLGDVYESIVRCPSVAELTAQGYLVPVQYYAPTIPDLTGVRKTAGDYNAADLERAMDKRELVGDIVSHWMALGENRPTIVFASGVQHSIHLRDEFEKAGISAAHIDGDTSREARDEVINGLKAGRFKVVTNCMVLTEGFDEPSLSCCVLARPTKSLGLFLQMGGRVLRPDIGKTDTILIDHSGNLYEHGLIEDDHAWPLTSSKALPKNHVAKVKERMSKTITCKACGHLYEGQIVCPKCGHKPAREGRYVETRHGHLTRLDKSSRKAVEKVFTDQEKLNWYGMFIQYGRERGYKNGWSAHAFNKKFGHFPTQDIHDRAFAVPPSDECKAYIKHLSIRYAKGSSRATERQIARQGSAALDKGVRP